MFTYRMISHIFTSITWMFVVQTPSYLTTNITRHKIFDILKLGMIKLVIHKMKSKATQKPITNIYNMVNGQVVTFDY